MILPQLENEFYFSLMADVTNGVIQSVSLFSVGLPIEVTLVMDRSPNNIIFVFLKLKSASLFLSVAFTIRIET